MTKEAYEMLVEILAQRVKEHTERDDYNAAFTYRNALDMLEYAQRDELECLRQYMH